MIHLQKIWKIIVNMSYGLVILAMAFLIWMSIGLLIGESDGGMIIFGTVLLMLSVFVIIIILPILDPIYDLAKQETIFGEQSAVFLKVGHTILRALITVPAVILLITHPDYFHTTAVTGYAKIAPLFQPRVIGGYTRADAARWEKEIFDGYGQDVLNQIANKKPVMNDIQLVEITGKVLKRVAKYDEPFFSKDTVLLNKGWTFFIMHPRTVKYITEGFGGDKKKNRLSKYISDADLKKAIAVVLEAKGMISGVDYWDNVNQEDLAEAAAVRFPKTDWIALEHAVSYREPAVVLEQYDLYKKKESAGELWIDRMIKPIREAQGSLCSKGILTLAAWDVKRRMFGGDTVQNENSSRFSPIGMAERLNLGEIPFLQKKAKSSELSLEEILAEAVNVPVSVEKELPFRALNPAFVRAWGKLIPEPSAKVFGVSAKKIYEKKVREKLMLYTASLTAMEKANMLNDTVYDAYIRITDNENNSYSDSRSLIYEYRFSEELLEPHLKADSSLLNIDLSPYCLFWLRRWKDGSAETLKSELKLFLKRYEPALLNRIESGRYIAVVGKPDLVKIAEFDFSDEYAEEDEGYEYDSPQECRAEPEKGSASADTLPDSSAVPSAESSETSNKDGDTVKVP